MAMTKAERAALDSALQELRIAKALRWSNAAEPVRIEPPKLLSGEFVNGWNFNTHVAAVHEMWTESSVHGFGYRETGEKYRNGSQNGRSLYATRLDALIGLRIAKEREVAESLAKIDAEIEKERTT